MAVEIVKRKICSRCKQEKGITEFSTNGHYITGGIRLNSWCLTCSRESCAVWQANNKEYFKVWGKAHREQTRLRNGTYRLIHPDKMRASKAYYRQTHKKEVKEYSRLYRQGHLDRIKEYRARYYPAYYLSHKDERISYQRTYRGTPTGRAVQRAVHLQRRAQMMGVETVNLARIIRGIRLSPSVTCHICGLSLPGSACHIDHIVPLSKGGRHVAENIAPAHPSCNTRKGTKLIKKDLARYIGHPEGIRKGY